MSLTKSGKEFFMMLLTIILFNLFCLTFANPFHKYPSVFLLDVGNEEIEKVTTDQIRISAPGGSIALRYPAIGNGDDIAHVRVSGIDFGTDLKANIVEGGPGLKYVVLVLMGNEGTPYDAVVTVKTVPNDVISYLHIGSDDIEVDEIDTGGELNESAIEDNNSAEEVHNGEIDENNSVEYLSDSELSDDTSHVSDDGEVVQETSNIYDYVQNDESKAHADFNVDQNDGDLQTDDQNDPSYIRQDSVSVNDGAAEEESLNEVENDDDGNPSYIRQPEANKYIYVNDNSNNIPVKVLDNELLEQYLALRARIFGNTVYDQSLPGQNEFERNNPRDYDEFEYIPRKDVNNNFIDRNGNLAVAY